MGTYTLTTAEIRAVFMSGLSTGRCYWDGYYGSDEAIAEWAWPETLEALLKEREDNGITDSGPTGDSSRCTRA